MKRFLYLCMVVALLGVSAASAGAQASAAYALSVAGVDGAVLNEAAALGAPDGAYATIGTAGGLIILDMGVLMQGTLTVYHSKSSPSCAVSTGSGGVEVAVGATTQGATSSVFPISGDVTCVAIRCGANLAKKATVFQLDAVKLERPAVP